MYDYDAKSELEKQRDEEQCAPDGMLIKTLTGKNVYLTGITLEMKGSDLHEKIQDSQGIPPDQQTLHYQGRKVDPEKTLAEQNISLRKTMTLILRLRGGGI